MVVFFSAVSGLSGVGEGESLFGNIDVSSLSMENWLSCIW